MREYKSACVTRNRWYRGVGTLDPQSNPDGSVPPLGTGFVFVSSYIVNDHFFYSGFYFFAPTYIVWRVECRPGGCGRVTVLVTNVVGDTDISIRSASNVNIIYCSFPCRNCYQEYCSVTLANSVPAFTIGCKPESDATEMGLTIVEGNLDCIIELI